MSHKYDLVLIVDDEKDLTQIFQETLATMGLQTVVANDGVEAMAVLEKHMPNISLVLCDISMPKMNGIEFLQHALAKFNYVPFVMLTAHSDQAHTAECLRLGAVDYMIKPFKINHLKENLPFWLEIGRRQATIRSQPATRAMSQMELLMRVKNAGKRRTG